MKTEIKVLGQTVVWRNWCVRASVFVFVCVRENVCLICLLLSVIFMYIKRARETILHPSCVVV